ncbi:MAG TPA: tRNA pseudouridine(38-40) synthase TruA [Pyrinomonadaceae bacterium]|jgi:tRNA pseudouridine38-40 synthase|nr:tRNA pseudouridine(38-40) synthase TruA [Pyrinomonadaceae bacterium]
MNFRLTIQYDGTDFAGWQTQSQGERTVQGELERALALLEGEPVTVHGAGRTDAGVHAEGQVASARLRREWEAGRLCAAINGNVGRDLRVIAAEVAAEDFHARFSARGKTYHYRIFNEQFASPFLARYAHHEARRLDVGRMRECASLFVGEHDWTAFSSAQAEVESRVRAVTRLDVWEGFSESGRGRVIEITVSAGGFLRYMARSIAGTLLAVGRGESGEDEIARALATGDRTLVGATAPARGLTLVRVHYDGDE